MQAPGCEEIDQRIKTYNFSDITKERDAINKEIGSISKQIESLNDVIPYARPKEEIENERKKRSEEAKTPGKPGDRIPLDSIFSTKEKSEEDLKEELRTQQQLLTNRNAQLRCLDLKISAFNTPEQDFKKTMSIIFSALIGLVILGFFILAWRDENMRRAIFSGQTGIQFLTLFSIVIAIILFGITGILQDKELAALLGGLSGYILGRYSNPSAPTSEGLSSGASGSSGEGGSQT